MSFYEEWTGQIPMQTELGLATILSDKMEANIQARYAETIVQKTESALIRGCILRGLKPGDLHLSAENHIGATQYMAILDAEYAPTMAGFIGVLEDRLRSVQGYLALPWWKRIFKKPPAAHLLHEQGSL